MALIILRAVGEYEYFRQQCTEDELPELLQEYIKNLGPVQEKTDNYIVYENQIFFWYKYIDERVHNIRLLEDAKCWLKLNNIEKANLCIETAMKSIQETLEDEGEYGW